MIPRTNIATRLWIAVGAIALVQLLLFGTVSWRSHQLTQTNQAAEARLQHISRLASRWAGLTESNAQRVVASVIGKDPAVAAHFAPEIKATSATISQLQQEMEALAAGEEDKAQLDKVAARRKTYIDARKATVALQAKGEAEAAQQQLQSVVLPAVKAYLAEQRAFVELQEQRAALNRTAFAEARQQSVYFAGTVVVLLLVGMVVGGLLLIRSIVRPLHAAGQVSQRIGQGDLTVPVDTSRHDETGELLRAVAGMRDSLRAVVSQVRDSTENIQVASTEVAQGNADLSQRTEQAASSLQQTASALEELTSTVQQTADSARTASQLAASASGVAARGGEVVRQVVATMDEINTSSRKIADITGVIDGIAFQTNILALNAAVEAARAGEQGRGFAVVAGEVRSLAQRSAEAAREIKSLIGVSVERVESGTRLVSEAGSTMNEIVGSVQRVTDIIGEISAATNEQSAGIGSVNGAVAQLDQATQQNAALVEESAAAAESLKEQALQLAGLVTGFNVGGPGANPGAARIAQQVVADARHKALASQPARTTARAVAPEPGPAAKPAPAAKATAPAGTSAATPAADTGAWESF